MRAKPGQDTARGVTCTMRGVWLLVLLACNVGLLAQGMESGDSVRINPKFMDELDRAFSFGPVEAPIKVPDEVLTREQLHEWVGPVDGVTPGPADGQRGTRYDPTDPNRFDSTYFALKMYLVDFCRWQPVAKEQGIAIPGLGGFTDGLQHYGKHCHSVNGGGIGATLDVNALSKYIRPSEIRHRRMRALADKARPIMDRYYPMEGDTTEVLYPRAACSLR